MAGASGNNQTINHSSAFLLPAAGRPGERDFLLQSRSPALFSAAAGLWRRGCWTRFSFPAACRLYATMRHFHSGLSRCLLNDALRDLADVSQAAGSCLIAPACHEQNDTGATHELGKVIQELGFFSQGQSHG